jgi:hypothetical protein
MYRLTLVMIGVLTMVGLGLPASSARADGSHLRQVTVTFGAGLNTAQPGNHINHEIIPGQILVKREGVVHFLSFGVRLLCGARDLPGDLQRYRAFSRRDVRVREGSPVKETERSERTEIAAAGWMRYGVLTRIAAAG